MFTLMAAWQATEAAIFERANFGIVADWTTVLPALQDALKNRLR